MKKIKDHSFLIGLSILIIWANFLQAAESIPVYKVEIVKTYPHDSDAFTQGLTVYDGLLYEGTGRNGQSSLRLLELSTGEILKRRNLSARYFGEGIAVMEDKIFQLTWQSSLGFVYDRESFSLSKTFFLPGEGWGLTHDGDFLIVSDGTSFLRFLDPVTQEEIRRIEVTDNNGPVDRINELEFINGEVWANIWYTDYLIRIDPVSGQVNSYIDLSDLYPQRDSRDDVLNGIAWDSKQQKLFVTGKLWPNIYEIQILE